VLPQPGCIWDDNLGAWRVSSGAFHHDDNEPSSYLKSILDQVGYDDVDVCRHFSRTPCRVASAEVLSLRELECEVLHDPVDPPCSPIDPAHCVIVLPSATARNQRKKTPRAARKGLCSGESSQRRLSIGGLLACTIGEAGPSASRKASPVASTGGRRGHRPV